MVGVSLPRAKTIPCTSGMQLRESHCTSIMGILAGCMLWPGRPMGRVSLPEAAIKRSKYGMQASRSRQKKKCHPDKAEWHSFYCLDINCGAQCDHCLHFVVARTVAVDPSLTALVVAGSNPVAEVAALERKVDTAVDPNLAALVVAGSSSVGVVV